jgi:hypothetical protein
MHGSGPQLVMLTGRSRTGDFRTFPNLSELIIMWEVHNASTRAQNSFAQLNANVYGSRLGIRSG